MSDTRNQTINYLRLNTQALHRQLDQSPSIQKMLAGKLTLDEYRQTLLCFYQVYQIIEPLLLAFEQQAFEQQAFEPQVSKYTGPRYRPRLPALQKELQQLQFNQQAQDRVEPSLGLYKIESLAAYLGARYVLDGSCHGAKWLLPRLQQGLNSALSEWDYWQLLASIHPDWASICRAIDVYDNASRAQDVLMTTAQGTFRLFIQQLQQLSEVA